MKNKKLVFIVIAVLSLVGMGIYLPKTIRNTARRNEFLAAETDAGEGTVSEVWESDDGYWLVLEEQRYEVFLWRDSVQNQALMDDLPIGEKVYYEFARQDAEAAEDAEDPCLTARSLKTVQGEIVTQASYREHIKKAFRPSLMISTFFSVGCCFCAAVSIAVVLKISIRPKEKSPSDGEEPRDDR